MNDNKNEIKKDGRTAQEVINQSLYSIYRNKKSDAKIIDIPSKANQGRHHLIITSSDHIDMGIVVIPDGDQPVNLYSWQDILEALGYIV